VGYSFVAAHASSHTSHETKSGTTGMMFPNADMTSTSSISHSKSEETQELQIF